MTVWLVVALLAAAAPAAIAQPAADLRLVEAIGWYTGTRGLVDEAKARTLIETAAFEGNVLARMWLARMYSRGRMGYPKDEARAHAIADVLVDAVRRQAAAGTVEAVFLMGTACDEGLGVPEDPAAAFEWFKQGRRRGPHAGRAQPGQRLRRGTRRCRRPGPGRRVVAQGGHQGRRRAAAAARRSV